MAADYSPETNKYNIKMSRIIQEREFDISELESVDDPKTEILNLLETPINGANTEQKQQEYVVNGW